MRDHWSSVLSSGRAGTDSLLGFGVGSWEPGAQVHWLSLSFVFIRYSDEDNKLKLLDVTKQFYYKWYAKKGRNKLTTGF